MGLFDNIQLTDSQLQQLILEILNPTEDFVPYRAGNIFQDSPAQFDSINQIIFVSTPVFSPRRLNQISATYTIVQTDDVVECTANTFTVKLPASGNIVGKMYTLFNSGAGIITFDGNGNTINEAASVTLSTDDSIAVMFNGTKWLIL